jgi:hypothetical protein
MIMPGFWQFEAPTNRIFEIKQQENYSMSGEQALQDWNREITSSSHILIEGVPINQIRKVRFKDVEELKGFFSERLFCKVTDEQEKQKLVNKAITIFHQGGLPFASHHCLVAKQKIDTSIHFPHEAIKTNFIPDENGVLITEDNTYSTITIGNKIVESSTYHAKTYSEILFTNKGIDLKKLLIDCPNRYASKILDQRSFIDLFKHFIKKVWQLLSNNEENVISAPGAPKM